MSAKLVITRDDRNYKTGCCQNPSCTDETTGKYVVGRLSRRDRLPTEIAIEHYSQLIKKINRSQERSRKPSRRLSIIVSGSHVKVTTPDVDDTFRDAGPVTNILEPFRALANVTPLPAVEHKSGISNHLVVAHRQRQGIVNGVRGLDGNQA